MAFSNIQNSAATAASASSASTSHDTSGDYNFVVVVVVHGTSGAPPAVTAITYGGVAIPVLATATAGFPDVGRVTLAAATAATASLPAAGSNTLAVTLAGSTPSLAARIWTGKCVNPQVEHTWATACYPNCTVTQGYDDSPKASALFAGGVGVGSFTLPTGETERTNHTYGATVRSSATDASNKSAHNTGLGPGAGGVWVMEEAPDLQPDTVAVEVEVQTTGLAVDVGANVTLLLEPVRIEVEVQTEGLKLDVNAPRQVALVGEGIGTAHMTTDIREDGSPAEEGDVLTRHDGKQPTWELAVGGISVTDGTTTVDPASELEVSGATVTDQGGGSALLTIEGAGRLVLADGISDPPEPVWHEDGLDFVYQEDMD